MRAVFIDDSEALSFDVATSEGRAPRKSARGRRLEALRDAHAWY
jgi:hypothetical protein